MSQKDLDEVNTHIALVKVLGVNSKEGLVAYASNHIPDKSSIDHSRLYFFRTMYKYIGIYSHDWVDNDIARSKKAVLEL